MTTDSITDGQGRSGIKRYSRN